MNRLGGEMRSEVLDILSLGYLLGIQNSRL